MGGEPYAYFTKYDPDIQKALDDLRENELAAGRYEPCFAGKVGKSFYDFGFLPRHIFPAPGGCHSSIDAVFENMGADGSNSILDIFRVVYEPFPNVDNPLMSEDVAERFNTAAPLAEDDLQGKFGTKQPTATQIQSILLATGTDGDVEQLQKRDAFWIQIDRGHCRYIVVYRDGEPDQIFFAGFSFD